MAKGIWKYACLSLAFKLRFVFHIHFKLAPLFFGELSRWGFYTGVQNEKEWEEYGAFNEILKTIVKPTFMGMTAVCTIFRKRPTEGSMSSVRE